MSLREEALKVAISQIGVEEDKAHTNKGEASKYQEAAGLGSKGGYAWCQAFVYWCYREASAILKMVNPVIRTGGVLDCWNRSPKGNRISKDAAIKGQTPILPGYQFIIKAGTVTGHTGFIERVEGTNLHTIEGNTNDEGSREGYEVCRRIRSISSPEIIGFIKY